MVRMTGDINGTIARLRKISAKSRAKMNRSPFLALRELPAGAKIKELKRIVGEMDKLHRTVMRLATGR